MSKLARGIYAILDIDRLAPLLPEDPEQERALLMRYAEAAVQGGAVALQLRDKRAPAHSLALASLYRDLVQAYGERVPVLMNDHLVAAQPMVGRPGVGLHVGQDDDSPVRARAALGDDAMVGISTHDLDQVETARRLPIDYMGFGPVRATNGKAEAGAARGFEALAEAAARTAKPVVAIGGLGIDDVAAVCAAGAHAMAVIGAWLGPADKPGTPERAALQMSMLTATWQAAMEEVAAEAP